MDPLTYIVKWHALIGASNKFTWTRNKVQICWFYYKWAAQDNELALIKIWAQKIISDPFRKIK